MAEKKPICFTCRSSKAVEPVQVAGQRMWWCRTCKRMM